MNATIDRALALWGCEGARHALVAARENRVYRVDHGGEGFALRLHRPGYRSDAELWSELRWLDAADRGGLAVPRPVASLSGELLQTVDGIQVDVVSWLPGRPLGATGEPLAHHDRPDLFHAIGREMARLHTVSDAWKIPLGFTRPAWDRAGLLGDAPVWGRFWENPTLTKEERDLFQELRSAADRELTSLPENLDFGLIHADLVRENVLVDGNRIQLIDFDDGGFGFRLFDVATTLLKNRSEPDYEALKAGLIAGYHAERALDMQALDLFMLLRAATYVGWIIPRMGEEGSQARNRRFIDTAKSLAKVYLS